MAAFANSASKFLSFNEYKVLSGKGNISAQHPTPNTQHPTSQIKSHKGV